MAPQWADEPFHLILTEPYSKDSSHGAYYAATQMTLAHNGIIRGLNSIYLQAPCIQHKDSKAIQDFLIYCQCWCESMHHHHEVEEQEFFPGVERVTKSPGLMNHNVGQHRAFTPGYDAFQEHVRTCSVKDFDGHKIRTLVDAFAEPLIKHLHDEIDTLRALDALDSQGVREAYDRMDKLMRATDNYRIAPLVFGTADRSFEGGMHDFPAVPFFVPYIIHYLFERRYRGAWRYNPCTSWRDRRELAYNETTSSAGA